MIYNTTEEAIAVVEKFEAGTLPKSEWTHAAHLTVGLYYCLRRPFGAALNCMRDGIRSLNDVHGVANTKTGGYHETMTVFWMIVIKQFAETSKRFSFGELANQLLVICDDPRLPLEYYSRSLLFSEKAREQHVQPDMEELYLFVSSVKLAAQTGGFADIQLA